MSVHPLPQNVLRLLKHEDSSKVLSVVSDDGFPHSVILGALVVGEDDTIYVGEAFMYRTSEYLEKCPKAEILVWMGKAGISVRATAVGRVGEGPELDEMNRLLNRKNMHATGLWAFEPLEIWDESASDTSGDRVLR